MTGTDSSAGGGGRGVCRVCGRRWVLVSLAEECAARDTSNDSTDLYSNGEGGER